MLTRLAKSIVAGSGDPFWSQTSCPTVAASSARCGTATVNALFGTANPGAGKGNSGCDGVVAIREAKLACIAAQIHNAKVGRALR